MIEIIGVFIVLLLYIEYHHKQYRIKKATKNIKYRNSHSYYDDTDYTKYKPYREIYTYKIMIGFLLIILFFEILFK